MSIINASTNDCCKYMGTDVDNISITQWKYTFEFSQPVLPVQSRASWMLTLPLITGSSEVDQNESEFNSTASKRWFSSTILDVRYRFFYCSGPTSLRGQIFVKSVNQGFRSRRKFCAMNKISRSKFNFANLAVKDNSEKSDGTRDFLAVAGRLCSLTDQSVSSENKNRGCYLCMVSWCANQDFVRRSLVSPSYLNKNLSSSTRSREHSQNFWENDIQIWS